MTSLLITLPAPNDAAIKSSYKCISHSDYKDLVSVLNLSDQNFSLVIVLNLFFWANLSLGILIKLVLIKKGVYTVN